MIWFGKEFHSELTDPSLYQDMQKLRREFARQKTDDILNLLDAFSVESFASAVPELIKESGLSQDEVLNTLAILPHLLKRENLEKRIKAEFTRKEVLDQFTKLPHGSALVRAVPHGIILHVTAGNVFLSSIDSLIMGFLTKNLSILKVSSKNQFFPMFFAKKLIAFDKAKIVSDKFAVVHWKGGDLETESFIKHKVNLIMAWGGEEMISSYRKNLPLHVKLLDFGPKVSFQVISREGLQGKNLELVAQQIVADIIPWNQAACASPQNLYLQEGISEPELLQALDKAFLGTTPRGEIEDDEAIEILKEEYRALYSELMEGGVALKGKEHLIHAEKDKTIRVSPLNRSIIVKRFRDEEELSEMLQPFSYYLQSCSYLLSPREKEIYLESLAISGIKRCAPLGTITFGMEGAPHDGRFVLRELVQFVGDEIRIQNYDEDTVSTNSSVTLKSHFESTPHPEGYIFSSGGTTGEPKYVHFSYAEFDFMTDMIALNFRKQGIKRGMKVANLFVAGNLWSSFIGVEKALEKIGVIQLPIGGLCSNENILTYLNKFRPDAVLGIPSLLVMNAEFMAEKNVDVKIPMVFYAGEALSEIRKEFLKKIWKTEFFGSAGYASVDAGVIGYQCSHARPGEHHLFTDLVDLKIIDEEAVVTSLARNSMPIVNYRTGDKVEWIEGTCGCGSSDKRFRLLGRVDNVIQIWSCRILTTDIEESLNEFGIRTFQISISESREANLVREKLEITFESGEETFDHDELIQNIYDRSRDVRDTIKFNEFRKDLILTEVEQVPRNERTGKISLVKDLRR